MADRYDNRGEWFREWDDTSSHINQPPRWYWLGMIASACWIVIYLLVYPSIPLSGTHWKGLGVLGGCQPWTAICELHQEQAVLDAVRAFYVARIRSMNVSELLADTEMSEFLSRAGKVKFGDDCAACHGTSGFGTETVPALYDEIWLHGGEVQAIHASILNPQVHPFGLVSRMDEVNAKVLAIYVYKFGGGMRPIAQPELAHE